MRRILIVGAGGHGKVVADLLRVGGAFEIAAFADEEARQRDGDLYLGARVLAGEGALVRARELGLGWAIVAVGDCAARLGGCERLRAHGFEIASAVHPRAVVAADVTIGAGTVVLAGAVVNTAARLGDAVLVNSMALVDHDCDIDDGVHVEPGATVGGSVRVGRATTIGSGATIVKGRRIGAHARVAPGAVVTSDVPDGELSPSRS
ncbi:MAG TPA: NeuD/PglB/VioB family sugar acetyltransferase [Polyangia bacterium]|jgi:sugar O-acyltransferase (sialic acid O-acetyltransferase NeuD family)